MFKLFKYLRAKEWVLLAVAVVFVVEQVWLDLKLPSYMSKITTLIQTPGSQMSEIWLAGLKMLLCVLGSVVGAVVVSFCAAKISATLSRNVREKLYSKVQNLSSQNIKKFSTSSLITRTTNDITQIQMTTALAVQVLIKAPIMAIWAITLISSRNWQWTLATSCGVFVIVIGLVVIMSLTIPKFKKVQKLTDNLNLVTRENLTGVRVVRAFNAEEFQEKKFEKANNNLMKNQLFTNRLMAFLEPGMTLVVGGLELSIYWIGAFLITNSPVSQQVGIFSDMVVFMSYAMQVVISFMLLIVMFMLMPRAIVASKRIREVLDTQDTILDGKFDEETIDKGIVEFRNVSFRYNDSNEYVLHDVSFTTKKGETIAFIGSTGSGKSTLINLIPRFYDATEGEILIDGVNIKDYTLQNLHSKIGYVPQKSLLFSGDIKSNMNFSNEQEYTEKAIDNALEIAQANTFVENLPDKELSKVSQGGSNFSGGQKQRLCIARAIVKQPEFLVFDDSFSALDFRTDKALRKALKNKTKDITTFIVAQRIGTIMDADKILVLEHGNVVGIGKHEDLMKNCPVYKEIALSQFSKEELENA